MAQPEQHVMDPQAPQQAQQLLSQLRDIRGLEDVSWWPLAPGWWILFGLVLMVFLGVFLFSKWRRTREHRFEAQMKAMMVDVQNEKIVKKKAQGLSEILRLAALRRYGRRACAGLEGKDWLNWLKERDPQNFDWPEKAGILIKAPYMPDETIQKDNSDFDTLFKAAERWIR